MSFKNEARENPGDWALAIGRLALRAAAVAVLLAPTSALAGTVSPVTTSFNVTATVAAACTVSASTLAFGTYDPTAGSAATGSTTVAVTCTNGSPYTVALGPGNGTGATTAGRKMTSAASNTLTYTLYSDNGYSTLWGTGADAVAGTGSGAAQNLTVYGKAPASQTAPAGSYSDTILVSVAF